MKPQPGRRQRQAPGQAPQKTSGLLDRLTGSVADPGRSAPAGRRPRLLWANCYCLLDMSSGASMAV